MNNRITNTGLWCLLMILSGSMFTACQKQTDTIESAFPEDYLNLQKGKYILYTLDSMRFVNFGQQDTTIHYQAKDVVDEQLTDAGGRTGWRIIRYLRPADNQQEAAWKADITYTVFPSRETIELVENNFRFQKLKLPVREGFSWFGNTHLPDNPLDILHSFSNDEDMRYWNYTYEQVGAPAVINGMNFDNTLIVHQVADSVNVPIVYPQGLAYKNYWVEQYAEGIGLIHKEAIMWEYQPPNGSSPGYRTGFGIKMEIIGHN